MRSDAVAGVALLGVPALLLAGALAFQYIGGLAPCEMCLWQRWALVGVLVAASAAVALPQWRRVLLGLAALALLVDAGLGLFHAGVEQKWWPGITTCTANATIGSTADMLGQLIAQPLVRCDAIAWSLAGISMAGWNAIIAAITGVWAIWMLLRA